MEKTEIPKVTIDDSRYLQLKIYQIKNDGEFRRVTKLFINNYEECKEQMKIGGEGWTNLFEEVLSKKEKWKIALAYQMN